MGEQKKKPSKAFRLIQHKYDCVQYVLLPGSVESKSQNQVIMGDLRYSQFDNTMEGTIAHLGHTWLKSLLSHAVISLS